MIKGSHNSWTYLKPKKWWMYLIRWTAKCLSKNIIEQYNAGVRCFDLRLKFKENGDMCIAHGLVEYSIDSLYLNTQLEWLDKKQDVKIRVLHEIRKDKEDTEFERQQFKTFCTFLECHYANIYFFCGRNLVNWNVDHFFKNLELSIEDAYGSVRKPGTIFALFPFLYAKFYKELETDKDVLMIDFV